MNTRKNGIFLLVLIFLAMMVILTFGSGCGGGGSTTSATGGALPEGGGSQQLSWTFGWRRIAGFNNPVNICIDANSIINISNSASTNIARYNSNGNQQSSIDINPYSSMGVGVDNNGNYYVADSGAGVIKYNSSWAAQLPVWNYPNARDAAAEFQNNLVVILASPNGNDLRITITDANGVQTNTWTKNNYLNPTSVALDSSNNICVVWSGSHCVVKYNQAGSVLATLGTPGTSSATDGQFNLPGAVHVAGNGNIYVTDQGNYRFQAFNSAGTFIGKFTGSQGDGDSQFRSMDGIVTDGSGNVYVTDALGNKIQRFTSN